MALLFPQLLSTPGVDSCDWGRGTQVSGAHPKPPDPDPAAAAPGWALERPESPPALQAEMI